MSKEKSATEKRKERSLQRKKEIRSFTKEYEESKKSLKKLGFGDCSTRLKEEVIKKDIKEWERNQDVILNNKYQDWEYKSAKYQQKYVEKMVALCPEAIEELRPLVPQFYRLFNNEKNQFYKLFDPSREMLLHLAYNVEDYIGSSVSVFENLYFDSLSHKQFRNDYLIGNFRFLFEVAYLLFVSNSKKQKNVVAKYIKNNLIPRKNTKLAKNTNLAKSKASEKILNRLINEKFLENLIERKLSAYFEKISLQEDIESYIKINLEIMKWAEKYNAEKDWFLMYAYDFIRQFNANNKLKSKEIKVGIQTKSSFHSISFKFNFDGWIPSQNRKTYEKNLRLQFEKKLESYYQFVGKTFNLNDKKLSTRPPSFNLIEPLVRKNVLNWDYRKLVELQFGIIDGILEEKEYKRKVNYLKESFSKLSVYDLPI